MAQISEAEFTIYLQGLHDAIGTVTKEKNAIADALDGVRTNSSSLAAYWHSPAYASFADVDTWFKRASRDLISALEDIINRLQTSYDNYKRTETTNFQNVDHSLAGPQPLTAGPASHGKAFYESIHGSPDGTQAFYESVRGSHDRTQALPAGAHDGAQAFYESVHGSPDGTQAFYESVHGSPDGTQAVPGEVHDQAPLTPAEGQEPTKVFYESVHGSPEPMRVPPQQQS